MRINRLHLLVVNCVALAACTSLPAHSGQDQKKIYFRNSNGQILVYNVTSNEILIANQESRVIKLSDCGNLETYCVNSPDIRIVAPKICNNAEDWESYSRNYRELEFRGFLDAARPVVRFGTRRGEGGFGYDFRLGQVTTLIVPKEHNSTIDSDDYYVAFPGNNLWPCERTDR